MLLFWQLAVFLTLCNKAVWPSLSLSVVLFLSQLNANYVIFMASRERIGWFSSHHYAGFLCDPVELPLFQQRKGRLSKNKEAYCTADPSFADGALGSQCHSQATPQDP